MLLSDGFLQSARKRLDPQTKISEADLRRCVSDLYFAMFHAVCETLAFIIQGEEDLAITREAWVRLYRLPDHSVVAKNCDDGRLLELPTQIQQFAGQFKTMKVHREDADYDASKQFEASKVRRMLELVETVLQSFKDSDKQHKLKFAVLVALKRR
ncbi:MAG: hypothetical protein ACOY4T_03675 [Pseudomonadota bacterium]